MSLLTHRLAVRLCLWHPERERRTVAHPKSQRTQVPLALTSTLELLRSPWATGGLCASARQCGKIWFEGLTAAKLLQGDRVVILRTEVTNPYEPSQSNQITQYAHPDKTHTGTHHVCGGQSEDTQALASKRGITSVTTPSRWSFHTKMCEENPEVKKYRQVFMSKSNKRFKWQFLQRYFWSFPNFENKQLDCKRNSPGKKKRERPLQNYQFSLLMISEEKLQWSLVFSWPALLISYVLGPFLSVSLQCIINRILTCWGWSRELLRAG